MALPAGAHRLLGGQVRRPESTGGAFAELPRPGARSAADALHDPGIRRKLYQALGQRHLRVPQHAPDHGRKRRGAESRVAAELVFTGLFRSGQPVSVYISDMDIEATYCYLSARHYRGSCIEAFSINSLRSSDPDMFEHTKRWVLALSRFATLISCSGELQRIHFFKRQRAIVAELEREGLEPSPEVFQE
mgnify:CR=1 FL=1